MPSASEHFPQRIALVHEWFSPRSVGGAELVVEKVDSLLRNLGCQPQLAALIDAESSRASSWLRGRSVLTSPIQRLPWGCSHVQQYLPLLPYAIEQIDVGAAELVISSSHLVAKGVLRLRISCTSVMCTPRCVTPGIRCMPIFSARLWHGAV